MAERHRHHSNLAVGVASSRAAMAAAVEHRGAFWAQVTMMILNDLTWVVFWFLVFSRVDDVRGWRVGEVLVLFAVFSTSIGIVCGVFANSREIARMVLRGEFEPLLTQPRHVLLRTLTARVDPPILGDAVFGPVLFLLSGMATLANIPLFVLASLLSAAVALGFLLIVNSSAFWLRGRSDLADTAFQAMTIFGMYPATIFGGFAKLVVFTIIPTAFITTMPAQLVTEFDWRDLGVLTLVAAAALALGIGAFLAGLRRYTLGNT